MCCVLRSSGVCCVMRSSVVCCVAVLILSKVAKARVATAVDNPVVLVQRVLFESVFVLLATGLLIW